MVPPAPQSHRPALFDFDGVAVTADGTAILREVTAAVPEARITVVVGPSGAGKTTLLRLCNRLEVASAGTVRFRGDDVLGLDPLVLRRSAGMVFQQPALFAGTVRDNLAVAHAGGDEERYVAAMRAASLDPGLLDRPAATLSGGEAQRACLARTLVTDPDVLLLDEPTAALEAAPKRAFEKLAASLAERMPMVWVTHDLAQVERIADHVIALVGGAVVFQGHPDDLSAVAALQGLYTGEDRS